MLLRQNKPQFSRAFSSNSEIQEKVNRHITGILMLHTNTIMTIMIISHDHVELCEYFKIFQPKKSTWQKVKGVTWPYTSFPVAHAVIT